MASSNRDWNPIESINFEAINYDVFDELMLTDSSQGLPNVISNSNDGLNDEDLDENISLMKNLLKSVQLHTDTENVMNSDEEIEATPRPPKRRRRCVKVTPDIINDDVVERLTSPDVIVPNNVKKDINTVDLLVKDGYEMIEANNKENTKSTAIPLDHGDECVESVDKLVEKANALMDVQTLDDISAIEEDENLVISRGENVAVEPIDEQLENDAPEPENVIISPVEISFMEQLKAREIAAEARLLENIKKSFINESSNDEFDIERLMDHFDSIHKNTNEVTVTSPSSISMNKDNVEVSYESSQLIHGPGKSSDDSLSTSQSVSKFKRNAAYVLVSV